MDIYKEGESYTFGYKDIFIYIFKVEIGKVNEKIYHIFLVDKYINECILHLPVSQDTLDKAELKKIYIKKVNFNGKDDGYNIWKEAYEKGEAGIWSVSIDEIIYSLFSDQNNK